MIKRHAVSLSWDWWCFHWSLLGIQGRQFHIVFYYCLFIMLPIIANKMYYRIVGIIVVRILFCLFFNCLIIIVIFSKIILYFFILIDNTINIMWPYLICRLVIWRASVLFLTYHHYSYSFEPRLQNIVCSSHNIVHQDKIWISIPYLLHKKFKSTLLFSRFLSQRKGYTRKLLI